MPPVGARLKTRDVLVKPDWGDCPQVNLQEAFGILDVGPSATEQEAKQAYRTLRSHPDRFRDDARLQGKASERLRKGIEAHRVIQSWITTQRRRSEATSSESSTEPKPKQEPEQHSFQVRAGSITHSRELVLSRERIQLAGHTMMADDVRSIQLRSVSISSHFIKTGTTSELRLVGSASWLQFSMHDLMYSRARTDMFHRIASLILRFYGSRILRNMKDTLRDDGSFTVGTWRFSRRAVEMPPKRLLGSGPLTEVPWARLKWSREQGDVRLWDAQKPAICSNQSLWTPNAVLVEHLIAQAQGR